MKTIILHFFNVIIHVSSIPQIRFVLYISIFCVALNHQYISLLWCSWFITLMEDFFFLRSYLRNHFYIKLLVSEDATDTSMWSTKHKADGVVTCEEAENKFYFPQVISVCMLLLWKRPFSGSKLKPKEPAAKWLPACSGIHYLLSVSQPYIPGDGRESSQVGIIQVWLTKPTLWWLFISSLFLLSN